MSRKEDSEKLLKILKDYLEAHPDIRFIQALWNLKLIDRLGEGIIDRFYEEPNETLERINRTKG